MVTGPINKEAINMAGCHYPGHTELLADLTHAEESGNDDHRRPAEDHVRDDTRRHQGPSIFVDASQDRKGHSAGAHGHDDALRVQKPRIGIAALNPHAGEQGLFGDEELRVISPAARAAQAKGILASDPMPADTLFGKAARGDYDAIVALYHDQGLIPLKMVAFGSCVNLTVGLPIIRTSVDHGTAFDIVGKGIADPGSLTEAVKLAARLVQKRRPAHASP